MGIGHGSKPMSLSVPLLLSRTGFAPCASRRTFQMIHDGSEMRFVAHDVGRRRTVHVRCTEHFGARRVDSRDETILALLTDIDGDASSRQQTSHVTFFDSPRNWLF